MEFEKDPKWEDALSNGELKHYKDDVYYNIDKYEIKRYWKDGLMHREDGPAIESQKEWLKRHKMWYKEGKRHRTDGPAIEWFDGYKNWYIEDKYYTVEEFNHKIKMMEFEKDPKWKKALSNGELKHYKDEIYYNVNRDGNKQYWKEGILHRDDGPAVEYGNVDKEWYIEGKYYTEEEYKHKIKIMEFKKDPKWSFALSLGELKHYKDEIYYNVSEIGDKRYWKDGKCHRADGPAVEYANGTKYWVKEDEYHRDDGPAIENINGNKHWFKKGNLHRLDGPAVEFPANNKKWWYIDGKEYTEEEFKKELLSIKSVDSNHQQENDVINRILAKQIIKKVKSIDVGVPKELVVYLLLGSTNKFGNIGKEIRVEIIKEIQEKFFKNIKGAFEEINFEQKEMHEVKINKSAS